MKTAIITGADGFIGTHLIEYLREKNVEIWAVVYPGSPNKDQYLGREGIHTICTELSALGEHIDQFPVGADAFYHFAWQGVNANARNDFSLQQGNISLTLECMELAAALRAKKFILPGSTSEYLYYGKPINEEAIPSPQNAYGSVKVALRYLAAAYARQLGLDYIYVVITGIYAADRKDNNVIFLTIDKLLDGEKPSLTRLEQKWDYIYIDDLVEALYLVGEKGKAGRFYAIGHGDNWPLKQYIEMVRQCIDPSLPLGIGDIPYQNERIPSSCIDLSAITEDTGFVPKVPFEYGIRKVIEAMKKEKSL